MLYCVSENELDLEKHEIVSGPHDDCQNCSSSSSSSSSAALNSSSSSQGAIDVSLGFTLTGFDAIRTNENPDGCTEQNPTWYGTCPDSQPYCPYTAGSEFGFYQTVFDFYYVDAANSAGNGLAVGWYFRVFGNEYAYNPGGDGTPATFPTTGWVAVVKSWYNVATVNGSPIAATFVPYVCPAG